MYLYTIVHDYLRQLLFIRHKVQRNVFPQHNGTCENILTRLIRSKHNIRHYRLLSETVITVSPVNFIFTVQPHCVNTFHNYPIFFSLPSKYFATNTFEGQTFYISPVQYFIFYFLTPLSLVRYLKTLHSYLVLYYYNNHLEFCLLF